MTDTRPGVIGSTTGSRLGDRLSQTFRGRRSVVLKNMILSVYEAQGSVALLDLGGRVEFWRKFGIKFLRDCNVKVTLLNLTHQEIGSDEDHSDVMTCIVGDATDTKLESGDFDIVFSNSVIEHLGHWDTMIAFASETRRLGKAYYCQTPNFWFPIDPHYYKAPFFHWFPRPTRAWMLRTWPIATAGRARSVRHSFAMTDYARLLSKTQLQDIFPDGKLVPERFLGVFVKSWMVVRSSH